MEKEYESQSDVPPLQAIDYKHLAIGSSTSAVELRSDGLRQAKHSNAERLEQRVLGLVRGLSTYRRELQFFRAVYGSTEQLILAIRSAMQQMILNYYLRPDVNGQQDEQWLLLSDELEKQLQIHIRKVSDAEADWLNLSVWQNQVDRSDMF